MASVIKIIPKIFGGLGNQLFCYAAARRLALHNSAELVIDDRSGFVNDYIYNRHYQLDKFHIKARKATIKEQIGSFSRLRRSFICRYNNFLNFEHRTYIQQQGNDFEPRLLQIKPRGTLYLNGYWQSEDYFKDVEHTIRGDLRIKPPIDETNQAMANMIMYRQAVALHVRYFDSPNVLGFNNIATDYYVRAVKKMEMLVPDAHYFVFSDYPEAACDRLPLPDSRITCVSHNRGDENAYADLWLMTQCRHFIIANSTFSWWGAWLADNPGKHVIAPERGPLGENLVSAWGFRGLLNKEWMKL